MRLSDFEQAAGILGKLPSEDLRTLANLAGLDIRDRADRFIAEQLAMMLGTSRPELGRGGQPRRLVPEGGQE